MKKGDHVMLYSSKGTLLKRLEVDVSESWSFDMASYEAGIYSLVIDDPLSTFRRTLKIIKK